LFHGHIGSIFIAHPYCTCHPLDILQSRNGVSFPRVIEIDL
jgi:hypothetical protein